MSHAIIGKCNHCQTKLIEGRDYYSFNNIKFCSYTHAWLSKERSIIESKEKNIQYHKDGIEITEINNKPNCCVCKRNITSSTCFTDTDRDNLYCNSCAGKSDIILECIITKEHN